MSSGKPQTGKEVVLMTTRSEVRFTADGDVELALGFIFQRAKRRVTRSSRWRTAMPTRWSSTGQTIVLDCC